jgi:hypothetical protein
MTTNQFCVYFVSASEDDESFFFYRSHLIGNAYPPKQGIFDFQGNTSSNQVFLFVKFGIILDYSLARFLHPNLLQG